jgi:hypothetical protein
VNLAFGLGVWPQKLAEVKTVGDDAISLRRAAAGDAVALALYGLRTELLFVTEYLGQFEHLRTTDPPEAERMLAALTGTTHTAIRQFDRLVGLLVAGKSLGDRRDKLAGLAIERRSRPVKGGADVGDAAAEPLGAPDTGRDNG